MHNQEDVFRETLAYFKGDTMAANVWIDKYCLKDLDGNFLELTPDDMHIRIAKELNRIEQKYINPLTYEEIYPLLKNFKTIIPGGSILFGIGNSYAISSLGNCFVIGNDSDSYGGILATDEEQVQLMKRRGGVGHDISHLRAKSSAVSNSAKTSTGSVSFMPRYSNSCREVAQDGRRGALMISIDIMHDDADDFIISKDDNTKITGANISVKIPDIFMQAIVNKKELPIVKRRWDKLVHQAWKSAEPGVLFIDTIQRESPADCYGESWRSKSTNPCGEIPLCPYDSCRLLSVNLMSCVEDSFTSKAQFNFPKLKRYAYIAQRLMDDIVDLEEEKIDIILDKISHDNEPEDIKSRELNLWLKIKEKLVQGRRTGLSGIGLADVLASLNIKYNDGKDIAIEIYKTIAISSYKSSIDMAEERGCFPIWDPFLDLNSPFVNRILAELSSETNDKFCNVGRRNIANLTIPPSGSLSILAGITSGIEPVFRLSYKRRRKVLPDNPNKSFQDKSGDWWEEYTVNHPGFQQWLELGDKNIDEDTPYSESTSDQINPIKKIEMIGGVQKWVDHAISQTLNLPSNATEKDVENIYIAAWENGLKGITVYRDGCRDGVLISNDTQKESSFHQHDAPKRPKILLCDIRKVIVSGKEWVVCIGLYDGKPFEVFAFENKWNFFGKNISFAGNLRKINSGQYNLQIPDVITIENITGEMTQGEEDRTRMISTSLRHGANVKFVIEQLNKSKNIDITSFSKAIARSLKHYIKDGENSTEACPKCGGTIIYRDGCKECKDCGDQKCG